MRVFRNASASSTTLASLGALYVVIVILTVLLSNRVLSDPDILSGPRLWVFVLIAALLPAGLLGAVILSLLRLLRDRRTGKPGAGFKARLAGFFAVVVLLAALPQGIVAVGVLSSTMQLLFNTNTGLSLQHGLDLALDYYDQHIHDLEILAADGTMQRIVDGRLPTLGDVSPGAPIWPEVTRRQPRAQGVQLFDGNGRELVFLGSEGLRLPEAPPDLSPGDSARIHRVSINGVGLLRMTTVVNLPDGQTPGLAVLTVGLPDGFERKAATITESIRIFSRLENLRPVYILVVALMYGFFSLPLLLLSILASFFFSDRIIRPIELLEEATRRVTDGDYSVRILSRPGEDLGVMVTSFNRMVNELDRARQRIAQAEKVQAWQEIAQRLAHEVKNPLTPIRLAAERLKRRYEAGADDFGRVLHRTTSTIIRETEALTALLNEFRSFSRLPGPTKEPVALERICGEAAAVYDEDPDVVVDRSAIAPDLIIHADKGQLRQIFVNLFKNSVEASGRVVRITCAADIIVQGGRRFCRIRVEDDGPGIPDEIREDIFQPYVTSKGGEGTGLGLAIVERIVYDHDGRIHVESALGSGTTFIILVPVGDDVGEVDLVDASIGESTE